MRLVSAPGKRFLFVQLLTVQLTGPAVKAQMAMLTGLRVSREELQRQLGSDSDRETLRAVLLSSQLPQDLISLLHGLLPELSRRYERVSAGCAHRLSAALHRLHRSDKRVEFVEREEEGLVVSCRIVLASHPGGLDRI